MTTTTTTTTTTKSREILGPFEISDLGSDCPVHSRTGTVYDDGSSAVLLHTKKKSKKIHKVVVALFGLKSTALGTGHTGKEEAMDGRTFSPVQVVQEGHSEKSGLLLYSSSSSFSSSTGGQVQ